MDLFELREKSGVMVTVPEYELINQIYMWADDIKSASDMAEIIKAHKNYYIAHLCGKYPEMIVDMNDSRNRIIEEYKLEVDEMGKTILDLDNKARELRNYIDSMADERDRLSKELDRMRALLRAYAKVLPLEDLAIKLMEVA